MRDSRAPHSRWKHGPIPVIGLIGGIGAGKSRVAEVLAGLGAHVLNADTIGHRLLEQSPARDLVLRRFGPKVLLQTSTSEGEPEPEPIVDRKALGALVFEDPSARRDLEAILHPRMRHTFEKAIARAVRKGAATAVVLDAAVLLEARWDDLCDLVLFVDAPRSVRRERLRASRGWNADELERREAAQLPMEPKLKRADAVISNAGDLERLALAVRQFWTRHIGGRPRSEGNRDSGVRSGAKGATPPSHPD